MRLSFHSIQYVTAGLLTALAMLGYSLCPEDRAEGFLTIVTLFAGFMVGKFTNGFGSKGPKEEQKREDE